MTHIERFVGLAIAGIGLAIAAEPKGFGKFLDALVAYDKAKKAQSPFSWPPVGQGRAFYTNPGVVF